MNEGNKPALEQMLDRAPPRDHDAGVSVDETVYVPDEVGTPRSSSLGDVNRFGRFRVIATLGSGATGSVYRAFDDVLGREVAVKALHPGCNGAVRARFLNEARAIGSVLHPNIIAVFDAGTEGDTPYFVMELARGSLRDAMHARRLDVEAVRAAGIQIARALAAAHAAKILHRDVKPANILCTEDGVWKLGDFGIARLPDSTLTDTGQFLGSPSYAAPESLRAAQFSPASDIYALAATLYEALAGAPPHGEHDMPSVVRKLEHDPPPLHLRCPVPRAMADVIMAALARDPAARPSADELAQRLASSTEAIVVVPPSSPRMKWIAIAAALFAAALLAVAIVVRLRSTSEPRPAVFASPRVDRAPTPPPKQPAPQVDPTPVPVAPAEPAMPAEPAPPPPPDEATAQLFDQPTQLFDHNGQPLDDTAAAQMLELLERDARREFDTMRRKRRARRGN